MSLHKLGHYHLFMGEAIETGITVLFACLSRLSETRLKCWWNNDNYFTPFFFPSYLPISVAIPLPISPLHVPSAWVIHLFPTQYSTTWARHPPYCHNTYLLNAGDLINVFPHFLLPAFLPSLPFVFPPVHSFSLLSAAAMQTLPVSPPAASFLFLSSSPSLIRRM